LNILHFEMNVPKEVALQCIQGTLVQGRFGDRVMFNLADGRVMYVPPIVATKIEQQSIVAGERFELCKTRVANGRRRSIEWHVRRKDASPEVDLFESQLESDLRDSIEAALANKTQIAPLSANGTGTAPAPEVNGNGKPPASAQISNGSSVPTTKLEQALKTAITAASNAEKFGAELGYVVRFDSDAIKSMAITVLINMSEGGRR
jgi:hypothetical protein